MIERNNYTEKERAIALDTSLTLLASHLGYTPERCGNHFRLKEMDSLIIYNDRTWYRWSKKGERIGGTQIDFLYEFGVCNTVIEAIHYLLNFKGSNIYNENEIAITHNTEKVARETNLVLPEKADSYRRAYAYLIKTRGLSDQIVNYFVRDLKLLYEDKEHHNLVFLGKDKNGEIKYATKRGTADLYGKKYKGDVEGNDKNYGINIVNKKSNILKVYESSIDCMSYIDIFGDYTSNKLVLGMVADNPLEQFIKDYNHIDEIVFCLDNDEAGKKALYGTTEKKDIDNNITQKETKGLVEKYEEKGFIVKVEMPLYGKDFNESLKEQKISCPETVSALKSVSVHKKSRVI